MRKDRHERRRKEEEGTELNLIPVMNLFVCLVPFLLLSAAFVRLGGVGAEVPSKSNKEVQLTQNEKDQVVDLLFQLDQQQLTITGFTQGFGESLEGLKVSFPIAEKKALANYLSDLKEKHPRIGSSLFKASDESRFEDAVSVLAVLRRNDSLKNIVLAAEVVE